MLAKADLVRIALRYDTLMSRAMLRACGCHAPDPWPKPGTVVRVDDMGRYADIALCFRNGESPMDGRAL